MTNKVLLLDQTMRVIIYALCLESGLEDNEAVTVTAKLMKMDFSLVTIDSVRELVRGAKNG